MIVDVYCGDTYIIDVRSVVTDYRYDLVVVIRYWWYWWWYRAVPSEGTLQYSWKSTIPEHCYSLFVVNYCRYCWYRWSTWKICSGKYHSMKSDAITDILLMMPTFCILVNDMCYCWRVTVHPFFWYPGITDVVVVLKVMMRWVLIADRVMIDCSDWKRHYRYDVDTITVCWWYCCWWWRKRVEIVLLMKWLIILLLILIRWLIHWYNLVPVWKSLMLLFTLIMWWQCHCNVDDLLLWRTGDDVYYCYSPLFCYCCCYYLVEYCHDTGRCICCYRCYYDCCSDIILFIAVWHLLPLWKGTGWQGYYCWWSDTWYFDDVPFDVLQYRVTCSVVVMFCICPMIFDMLMERRYLVVACLFSLWKEKWATVEVVKAIGRCCYLMENCYVDCSLRWWAVVDAVAGELFVEQ